MLWALHLIIARISLGCYKLCWPILPDDPYFGGTSGIIELDNEYKLQIACRLISAASRRKCCFGTPPK
jgi:hypothetical protein